MQTIHTLLYIGPFDAGFQAQWSKITKGVVATEKVTGRSFWYMRRSRSPEADFVVGVDGIVLRAPVLLVHERHTDAKPFVADNLSYFGDDSAMRLLMDMIVANHEYRDELGRLVRGLGPSPKRSLR